MNTSEPQQLSRVLGKLGLAAIAINGLIGAGIFALPAAAANQLGHFSPWMFIVCGLVMLPIVAGFAYLSSMFSGTGGPVLYASQSFGPFVGFQTGWLLYVGRVSALAANGHALVLYLSIFVPDLADPVLASFSVCVLIAFLALLNVLGVKRAQGSILLVTALKLLPILLFVLFGLTYLNAEILFSAEPPALKQFPVSMLLLVYAFIGFEGALVPAGEAKSPKSDMPKAILLTLFAATILYFFIQAIVVHVLPMPIVGRAPLADAASNIGLDWGFSFGSQAMLLTAVISIFGNLLALMLAAPRMTFALAEQKQLPHWFANLHPTFNTPTQSIYFLSGCAMLLALTGGFIWLAIISSLARLIGYLICIAGIPKLHAKQGSTIARWQIFLLTTVGGAACVWLMSQASLRSWMFTLGFILIGALLYYISRRERSSLEG